MTIQEAKVFFPFDEEDDIDDLFEQRLFEYQQFFLTKEPLDEVFKAKLKKLKQLNEAYLVIAGKENSPVNQHSQNYTIQFSEVIELAFHSFQVEKNQFKKSIHQAKTVEELEQVVFNYIALNQSFSKKWPFITFDEAIGLGQAVDEMLLLKDIQLLKDYNCFTFSDLAMFDFNQFEKNPFLVIQKECKRLSLLAKRIQS